ncbi:MULTISPECIES: GNAT family protein [unclassified Pseudoalteromonas]|uniref:GNAT family protein n=1 Tax=Pseudoalteromonas sp. SD03 TaxID=3231719 RepID=A0AB39AS31_9GAMM|nr:MULTISPECIES: GNAT family protein [unclassified Pseudoalteromonas]MDN3396824.1 GNAT family protein [Pseudoalteromonas sp. APC 3215]MDN3406993.1 GNAT family protein [Pseudoalteromonas sp. APC 3218]MDN3472908.1 GNAT family protein [Pseudoalteromonas sp. APC 4026]|tara:strand:+ start:5774 stop:6292 length:519 start_codon:yes stop_codon:yes gene_type:complete
MMKEIFLRELSIADIEILNEWRNTKKTVDYLGANFRYVDMAIDKKWFENYQNNRANNVRLAICCQETNQLLGAVYLLNIDWLNRNTEFAIWLGDESIRGQGVGERATTLALEHAFLDLNLHRVYLTVLEKNLAAIGLYNKIGFKKEGTLVDAVYKNGKYINMTSMAIIKKSN